MATIKAIEPSTVHQIQSGQVIVDLCSVVKELVENCLDAGASIVDVRFKNQGLESIEVQDNGTGISPENYETIALKHYTSKLAKFSDMDTLETFGFRGEALSSLCALSNLCITTCVAEDAPKATKLDFDSSGRLGRKAIVAGQKGTIVTVQNLFHNLPVRRRELERNIKREWNKTVTLLNQYACIQTNLKFTVSQQPSKGKRIVLFATKGNPTTRENIINIFGTKTMSALLELDAHLEFQPTIASRGGKPSQESAHVHVRGFVSRPVQGDGRQTPDRQMLFVNSRPCLLPQFSKVFNEVYRMHNPSQSPFILADIRIDTHLYDVNVSPDKRTILLHEQGNMLEELRAALVQIFEQQDYSIPRSQLVAPATISHDVPGTRSDGTLMLLADDRSLRNSKDSDAESPNLDDSQEDEPLRQSYQTRAETQTRRSSKRRVTSSSSSALETGRSLNFMSRWMATTSEPPEESESYPSGQMEDAESAVRGEPEGSISPIEWTGPLTEKRSGGSHTDVSDEESRNLSPMLGDIGVRSRRGLRGSPVGRGKTLAAESAHSDESDSHDHDTTSCQDDQDTRSNPATRHLGQRTGPSMLFNSTSHNTADGPKSPSGRPPRSRETPPVDDPSTKNPRPSEGALTSPSDSESVIDRARQASDSPSEEHMVPVAVAHLQASTSSRSPSRHKSQDTGRSSTTELQGLLGRTKSTVSNVAAPDVGQNRPQRAEKGRYATAHLSQRIGLCVDEMRATATGMQLREERSASSLHRKDLAQGLEADDAEETLSLIVTKADFAKMTLVGQFNLGFILAMRHATSVDGDEDRPSSGDQLFIIDQHASDEKFNFERLQATTVLQSQRLVRPKRLDLTALEEEIVKENITALERNGFQVRIDESGAHAVGSRCELVALPLSRETTFSLDDLEELISLLGDDTNSVASQVPRPSKVRKIFAMRACRSSIMIGRALTRQQMGTLVRHMGQLDKPWNCPHGRPTMRHLCGLQDWDAKCWQEDDVAQKRPLWAEYSGGDGN